MLRNRAKLFTASFLAMFFFLLSPTAAYAGPTLQEYVEALDHAIRSGWRGAHLAPVRQTIDEFEWPRKDPELTSLERVTMALNLYKLLQEREALDLSNKQLALITEALGKLVVPEKVKFPGRDSFTKQIAESYVKIRAGTLTMMGEIYADIPATREKELLKANIEAAFSNLGAKIPTIVTENPNPVLRMMELVEQAGKTPESQNAKLNEIYEQIDALAEKSRTVKTKAAEMPRAERIKIAARLAEVLETSGSKPGLLLATRALPAQLLDPETLPAPNGPEKAVVDRFAALWNQRWQDPDSIRHPPSRAELVEDSIKQLTLMGLKPHALQRATYALKRLTKLSQPARPAMHDIIEALTLTENPSGLSVKERVDLATIALDALKDAPDGASKMAGTRILRELLNKRYVIGPDASQQKVIERTEELLKTYAASGSQAQRDLASEALERIGKPLVASAQSAAPAATPKHPLERIVELAREAHGAPKSNAPALTAKYAELRTIADAYRDQLASYPESVPALDRKRRFELAKELADLWTGDASPTLVQATRDVPAQLVGPQHAKSLKEDESMVVSRFLNGWNERWRNPESVPTTFRNVLVADSLEQLKAFNQSPHPLEQSIYGLKRATEVTAPVRPPIMDVLDGLTLSDRADELKPGRRIELAKLLFETLENKDLDERTRSKSIAVISELLDSKRFVQKTTELRAVLDRAQAVLRKLGDGRNAEIRVSSAKALDTIGRPLDEANPSDKITGDAPTKHPLERIVELARESANLPRTNPPAIALKNQELRTLADAFRVSLDREPEAIAPLDRARRFALAKELADLWTNATPIVLQATRDVPAQLIGPQHARRLKPEESEIENRFIDTWNGRWRNPDTITNPNVRGLMVEDSLAQLKAFERSPHPLEQAVYGLKRAAKVTAQTRTGIVDALNALSLSENPEALKPAGRIDLARTLLSDLEGADLDDKTKSKAIEVLSELINTSRVQMPKGDQKDVVDRAERLLTSYGMSRGPLTRAAAVQALVAIGRPASFTGQSDTARPSDTKHPLEHIVALAKEASTIPKTNTPAITAKYGELRAAADAYRDQLTTSPESIPALDRKRRFELAKELADVWTTGASPTLVHATREVPAQLVGPQHASRLKDDESAVVTRFVDAWNARWRDPESVTNPALRNVLVADSLEQLKAFDYNPHPLEQTVYALKRAVKVTNQVRAAILEPVDGLNLAENPDELKVGERVELARTLLDSLEGKDLDDKTKGKAVAVLTELLDASRFQLLKTEQKLVVDRAQALLNDYTGSRGVATRNAASEGLVRIGRPPASDDIPSKPAEEIDTRHPLARMVELAKKSAATPKTNAPLVTATNAHIRELNDDYLRQLGEAPESLPEMDRATRYRLASELAQLLPTASPTLAQSVRDLPAHLIADHTELPLPLEEQRVVDSLVEHWNNRWRDPDSIAFAPARSDLVSDAITQLKAFHRAPHPLEQAAYGLKRAAKVVYMSRGPILEALDKLDLTADASDRRVGDRLEWAKTLLDAVENVDLDERTKTKTVEVLAGILDPTRIEVPEEQKTLVDRAEALLTKYATGRGPAMRDRALQALTTIGRTPVVPPQPEAPAAPPKHPLERLVQLTSEAAHLADSNAVGIGNRTKAITETLADLQADPAKAEGLSRAQRFQMLGDLLDAWETHGVDRSVLLDVSREVPAKLVLPTGAMNDEERAVIDRLERFWDGVWQSPEDIAFRPLRTKLPEGALAELKKFGREPHALEVAAYGIKRAIGMSSVSRGTYIAELAKLDIKTDPSGLSAQERSELAKVILDAAEGKDDLDGTSRALVADALSELYNAAHFRRPVGEQMGIMDRVDELLRKYAFDQNSMRATRKKARESLAQIGRPLPEAPGETADAADGGKVADAERDADGTEGRRERRSRARTPRHVLEEFVRDVEQAANRAGSGRNELFQTANALNLADDPDNIRNLDRYALAERLMAVLHSDPRLLRNDDEAETTGRGRKFSFDELTIALKGLSELLSKEHIKAIKTEEGPTQLKVESMIRRLHRLRAADDSFRAEAASALEKVGGVVIYDAESFLKSAEEHKELWLDSSSPTTRRSKLERALRNAPVDALLKPLTGDARADALRRITVILRSERPHILHSALRAAAALGGKEGRRRSDLPPEMVDRIKELSSMSVGQSESLARIRSQATEVLQTMGHQAPIQLATASEYARAIREVDAHYGPKTERILELEQAIDGFGADKLKGSMSVQERTRALQEFEAILNSKGRWARGLAIPAVGDLLNVTTADPQLSARIRKQLWALTPKTNNAFDSGLRAKSIAALEQLGEKPTGDIAAWMKNVEELARIPATEKISSSNFHGMDLFDLGQAARKLPTAERRVLMNRLAALLTNSNHPGILKRAMDALGHFANDEVRGGAGVPRAAFEALHEIAQNEKLAPMAQATLEKIGAGTPNPVFNQELYEQYPNRGRLAELVAELKAPGDASRAAAIKKLEAWTVDEAYGELGLVEARGLASQLGQFLFSADPDVKRAALTQIWKWSREYDRVPNWIGENITVRQGLGAAIGFEELLSRTIARDTLLNHFAPPREPNPELFASLTRTIESPQADENSRWIAAQGIRHLPVASDEDALQKQLALRVAFARASEDHKHAYAALLGDYKQEAPRPSDPVLLAAEWIRQSSDEGGDVDPTKLQAVVQAALQNQDARAVERAFGAIGYLSADPLTGNSRFEPQERMGSVPIPKWITQSPDLTGALLRQLTSPDEKVRNAAVEFFRTREPWIITRLSPEVRQVAWQELAKANRYPESARMIAKYLVMPEKTDRKVVRKMTVDEALLALKAAEEIHPQFHEDVTKTLLDTIASIDKLDFDTSTVSREALAKRVLEVAKKIEKEGNKLVRPVAMAMAQYVWRGIGRSEIDPATTDEAVKLFRNWIAKNGDPNLELFGRLALTSMGRKFVRHGRVNTRARIERHPLGDILSRLLADDPAMQLQAAKDLKRWSYAPERTTTLRDQLRAWRGGRSGPDFDQIVSVVLNGQFPDAKPGDAPLASIEVRRELLRSILAIGSVGLKEGGFLPGMTGTEKTDAVIAELLFSEDPELRKLAEEWATYTVKMKQSTAEDAKGRIADRPLARVMTTALRDPARKTRALELLDRMIAQKADRNSREYWATPYWMSRATELHLALLDTLAAEPVDNKQSVAELLVNKIGSSLRVRGEEVRRPIPKEDRLDLLPIQERVMELVPKAIHILNHGDIHSKVAAMEFLIGLEIPDPRIPEAIFSVIKDPTAPKELRAQAQEILQWRMLPWDYVPADPRLEEIVLWNWERFQNETDPELRRLAARFLFANSDLIHDMPHRDIAGVRTHTAYDILLGLREIDKRTQHNPLPEDLKGLINKLYSEIFRGVSQEDMEDRTSAFDMIDSVDKRARAEASEAKAGEVTAAETDLRAQLHALVRACRGLK